MLHLRAASAHPDKQSHDRPRRQVDLGRHVGVEAHQPQLGTVGEHPHGDPDVVQAQLGDALATTHPAAASISSMRWRARCSGSR